MKLETKIKKYIKLIKETENTVNKQYYLQKLNECKHEVIERICKNDDFFNLYYNPSAKIYGIYAQDYIQAFFSLYSIKNIVCKLDKNINTQIVNIDFDI